MPFFIYNHTGSFASDQTVSGKWSSNRQLRRTQQATSVTYLHAPFYQITSAAWNRTWCLDCLVTKIHKAFIFIILISSFGSDLPLKGVLRSRGQILSAKAFTLGIWSQAEDQIPCSRSNAKLLSDITIMIKLPVMNNFFKRAKKSFHHLTYISWTCAKKKQQEKHVVW